MLNTRPVDSPSFQSPRTPGMMQPPNHIPYTSAAQGDKRRPTTMYTGRNGFAQVEHSKASDVVKHNRFLENKRFADFVLQSRGSGISYAYQYTSAMVKQLTEPFLHRIDDMEKELQQLTEDERPKDREAGKTAITRTEARIVKLQEEQVAELEKMYGMEAQDYLDEMEHRYYSRLHEPAVLDAEKHMEVSYPIASASTLECDFYRLPCAPRNSQATPTLDHRNGTISILASGTHSSKICYPCTGSWPACSHDRVRRRLSPECSFPSPVKSTRLSPAKRHGCGSPTSLRYIQTIANGRR